MGHDSKRTNIFKQKCQAPQKGSHITFIIKYISVKIVPLTHQLVNVCVSKQTNNVKHLGRY